jgi:hypothetical protein
MLIKSQMEYLRTSAARVAISHQSPKPNETQTDGAVDATVLSSGLRRPLLGTFFLTADKKDVVNVLRDQSPQQLQATRKAFKAKTGVELSAALSQSFSGADLVEVSAYARSGKLGHTDRLRLAVVDEQGRHALGLIDRKSPEELQQMRRDYLALHGKELDADLLGSLEGPEKKRAEILLQGEPTRRSDESVEQFQKRQGRHVVALLQNAGLMAESQDLSDFRLKVDSKYLLDSLHDRSPEVLRATESAFLAKTGKPLREALEDSLTGTNETMALNYLDDGKEDSMEKLRRAFDGNNDEALIRRTLREQTPEGRKRLLSRHGAEIGKLFEQLDDEEVPEMEALLRKGHLDQVDHLKVAIGDGNDKKILSALRALKPEQRATLSKDKQLMAKMCDALDSDEFVEANRFLSTGSMSFEGELRHASSAQDIYRLAARAKTSDEKKKVFIQGLFGVKGVNKERLEAHLKKGDLSVRERLMVSDGRDLLSELRGLSPEALKSLRSDQAMVSRIRDELTGDSEKEGLELLAKGPLPVHQSLRWAAEQDDESRILGLLSGLKDDKEKRSVLREYRNQYRSDLRTDLDKVLSGGEMRQADNSLRTGITSASQVESRVQGDMLRDREDNGLFSSASNGITDLFSDAGLNMDDKAREVKAALRAHGNRPFGNLDALKRQELSFQDSRQVKYEASKEIADIAVPLITGILTAGVGSAALGTGVVANLLQSSWVARSAFVGGSIATRYGVEKTFRGNDFGTSQDMKTSALAGATDAASALLGASIGNGVLRTTGSHATAVVTSDIASHTSSVFGEAAVNGNAVDPRRILGGFIGEGLATRITGRTGLKGGFWRTLGREGSGLLVNEGAKRGLTL